MDYWENALPWLLVILVMIVAGLTKSLVPILLTALGSVGLLAWWRIGR